MSSASHGWTHNLCARCWAVVKGIDPTTMRDAIEERCCLCGDTNHDGIYYRFGPEFCRTNRERSP